MFICTRGSLPQIADQDDGRAMPFPIGMPRRYAAIGLQVGLSGRLGEDLTATVPATGGSLKVATLAFLSRLPATGKIQIDNERLTYAGKDPNTTSLTGITRQVDGTVAAAHTAGVPVQQVLPTSIYGFGENPRLVHFIRGNVKVFVNGKLKDPATAPTHTVNLDDRAAVANHSFGTITFDTASPVPTAAQAPSSGLMYDTASRGPRPGITSWSAGGSSGVGVSSRGGGDYLGVTAPIPPATVPPAPVAEYPPGLVGTVEVELEGLQDDAEGTITGVANSLIRRPMHVCKLLLREAWNERTAASYKQSTFDATHTKQAALNFNWDFVFEGMAFAEFQRQALLMGRADLYNESALWQYVWRERAAPAIVLTPREIVEDPVLYQTPRTELVEDLIVQWDVGTFLQSAALRSSRGRPPFGAPVPRTLALPWVQAEAHARYLGIYWLSQWDLQRMQARIPTWWWTLPLELGDSVGLDTDVMAAFGVGQTTFAIRRKELDLDTHLEILEAEEQDAPAIVHSGKYRIRREVQTVHSGRYALRVGVFRGVSPLTPLIVGKRVFLHEPAATVYVGGCGLTVGWDSDLFWDNGINRGWDWTP